MSKNKKGNGSIKSTIICLLITVVIFAAYYYFALPAINIHSPGFWVMIIIFSAIFFGLKRIAHAMKEGNGPVIVKTGNATNINLSGVSPKDWFFSEKAAMTIIVLAVLVMIIGGMAGAKLFRAKTYSGLISLQEEDFKVAMPETTEVTNIALMDTNSASRIGSRALGNLSEVVSQYNLAGSYTQINYNGKPQKVANLEYNGFFKWINNRSNGVPGYVMVDPVKNTAKYVELEKSLKYVDSAYFGEDLYRKLRFSYPTKIFNKCYYEIDEEGNPYYIISCLAPNAGLFSALDVNEVIIFNPCDGSSDIYNVGDVPKWVDIVYDGDLASDKYNWYGILSNGFWNSIIGQKGCKQTTDDYGYIMMDDDVWYYTGVTSVLSDESNIGFIMTNARTGEYKYYPIVGAEEHSAMSAAEGEVQEKGYVASFPSLINVADQATYIMVLKDSGGLVKRYALVNVENYGYVATGETQAEAIASYKKLLIRNNVIPSDTEIIEIGEGEEVESLEAEIVVNAAKLVTIDGNSYIYISDNEGNLYKVSVAENEKALLINDGDSLSVKYTKTDVEDIYQIVSWEKLEVLKFEVNEDKSVEDVIEDIDENEQATDLSEATEVED